MAVAVPAPLVVSERMNLVELIQCVLKQDAPSSTLVICSTPEAFMQQLRSNSSRESGGAEDTLTARPESDDVKNQLARWATPTLRLLASSRRIKLAFCKNVVHLRAYLAAYSLRNSSQPSDNISGQHALLVLVNSINLHRDTSAFSAQGLNRSFALAVEAAARAESRLILAECISEAHHDLNHVPSEYGEHLHGTTTVDADPWDEEVSILNVSTKTFGAGKRGWVGRTVKIRTIAERWCRFGMLSKNH